MGKFHKSQKTSHTKRNSFMHGKQTKENKIFKKGNIKTHNKGKQTANNSSRPQTSKMHHKSINGQVNFNKKLNIIKQIQNETNKFSNKSKWENTKTKGNKNMGKDNDSIQPKTENARIENGNGVNEVEKNATVTKQYSSNWLQLKQILDGQSKAQNSGNPPESNGRQMNQGAAETIKHGEVVAIKKDAHTPGLFNPKGYKGITNAIALDCEMVGVGEKGKVSMVARVSVVNTQGAVLYDKYVKPQKKVVNYRTEVSGIQPQDLETGADFKTVQKEVAELLKARILVGHSVRCDLAVLDLSHPPISIRDTAKYKVFKDMFLGKSPSLKNLAQKVLNITIQEGEHSSIQDAQASMRIYNVYRKAWEHQLKQVPHKNLNKSKKKMRRQLAMEIDD